MISLSLSLSIILPAQVDGKLIFLFVEGHGDKNYHDERKISLSPTLTVTHCPLERSPIFLQWIDCVYQIMVLLLYSTTLLLILMFYNYTRCGELGPSVFSQNQFPRHFQFNSSFLVCLVNVTYCF